MIGSKFNCISTTKRGVLLRNSTTVRWAGDEVENGTSQVFETDTVGLILVAPLKVNSLAR